MCFLLLELVIQMALIPQTAGTGSFSQMTDPFRFPSNTSGHWRQGALLCTSLLSLISPNWRVFECCLGASFVVLPLDPSSTERERSLNASFIGSASRHPTTLWEEINRYTCHHMGSNSKEA